MWEVAGVSGSSPSSRWRSFLLGHFYGEAGLPCARHILHGVDTRRCFLSPPRGAPALSGYVDIDG